MLTYAYQKALDAMACRYRCIEMEVHYSSMTYTYAQTLLDADVC